MVLGKRRIMVAAVLLALVVTSLIAAIPTFRFAYEGVSGRIVIDTAASMIAGLLALLIYGRLRDQAQLDLSILVFSLGLTASSNFFLSAIPLAIVERANTDFASWAPAGGRLVAGLALLASAYAPPRRITHRRSLPFILTGSVVFVTVVIAFVVALGEGWLPTALDPALSPLDSGRPAIVGHPLARTVQIALLFAFSASAAGFVRRLTRTDDDLYAWLAAFAGFSAVARLHYALFPSLYSNWIYTGDFVRLAALVVLMGGAVSELRRYWAVEAAAGERRRMARDFHDGLAQELAYISSLVATLPVSEASVEARIAASVRRATMEARLAISALRSPDGETLTDAVMRVAGDAGRRFGVAVHMDSMPAIEARTSIREAAQRITYEAISNAARHGLASTVQIGFSTGGAIRLRIRDDGRGLTAGDEASVGAFGIIGMRERAEAGGGSFEISSDETGTLIEVTFS